MGGCLGFIDSHPKPPYVFAMAHSPPDSAVFYEIVQYGAMLECASVKANDTFRSDLLRLAEQARSPQARIQREVRVEFERIRCAVETLFPLPAILEFLPEDVCTTDAQEQKKSDSPVQPSVSARLSVHASGH